MQQVCYLINNKFVNKIYLILEQGPLFKCSGTIITNKFVLTAAHCIPDDLSTL